MSAFGEGPVDRAVGNRRAGVAGARRTGDRIVDLIENDELVAERRASPGSAAGSRRPPGTAVGKRRCTAAALDVGAVAVDVRLLEIADVAVALDRPAIGEGERAVEREQPHLVCVVCGQVIDRPLDRGRASSTGVGPTTPKEFDAPSATQMHSVPSPASRRRHRCGASRTATGSASHRRAAACAAK